MLRALLIISVFTIAGTLRSNQPVRSVRSKLFMSDEPKNNRKSAKDPKIQDARQQDFIDSIPSTQPRAYQIGSYKATSRPALNASEPAASQSTENSTAIVSIKPTEPDIPVSKHFELIPYDKEQLVNAATAAVAIFGVILGGPVLAALFAAVANYVAQKENDSGEALRGVGKSVIRSFNFLGKLNFKYDFSGKLAKSLGLTLKKDIGLSLNRIWNETTNVSVISLLTYCIQNCI